MTDTIIQFKYSDDVFMTAIFIKSDTHQETFIPSLLDIVKSCEYTNKNISNMHDDKFKFISHPKEMEPEDVRKWIDGNKEKEVFTIMFLKDLQEAFPNNKVEFGRGERILIDGKIVPGILCNAPRMPYDENLEAVINLIKLMMKI